MVTTKQSTATANPLINTILVFTVGLSALEISQLIFDPSNASSLTTLDFNDVFEQMFTGMFLSADTLVSFWAVLVAWGISGAIAGVRAKNGFWGAVAGFLGTITGAVFLGILNTSALSDSTSLVEFGMGTIACSLVACFAAFALGNATRIKSEPVQSKGTRKIWTAAKSKDVWKCNKCGNSIPPGAFNCPVCGEPVIE
jgi:hypothetical protein